MEELNLSLYDLGSSVTNTFALPHDRLLRLIHEVYKPSAHTKRLKSEVGRTIYSEEFIENHNLGTLADLCVRALARGYGPYPLPLIKREPLHLQIHYENLDVDMPLKECYFINEERFWKRVVLAKSTDKALALKRDYDWKSAGVSMKLVEIIESCPAEYWPEEEMTQLASLIKDFVKSVHIKRLQSLSDHSFLKHFRLEESSSSSEEEDDLDSPEESPIETSESEDKVRFEIPHQEKTDSELELEEQMAEEKAERKRQRQELREAREKALEVLRSRRERREARRLKKLALEEALTKKQKKKKTYKQPKNFFDIPLSESEDDGEGKICDMRNKEFLLATKKHYDYPPDDCHHVDLSFLQHFIHLDTICIEFLGPHLHRNYHFRHLNFSYDDIRRLASGISQLPVLRVFRLRNSRMDANKLSVLVDALKDLPSLQVVDFGFDCLQDDCGPALKTLLSRTESICHLELESNQLDVQSMQSLGEALINYTNGTLQYLGLARNPLSDQALHAITTAILETEHIKCLNIRGVTHVTEAGIACCIANELLRQHPNLQYFDMSAIETSPFAADEIIKALDANKIILGFQCRGCNLDSETEMDINVILKRNKYISENPFVGDQTVTNEEIDAWLNRTRNPIMLSVRAERKKLEECLAQRPKEFKSSSESEALGDGVDGRLSARRSTSTRFSAVTTFSEVISDESSSQQDNEPFIYNPNEFTEKEFMEHLYLPGHGERYYYFKQKRSEQSQREH